MEIAEECKGMTNNRDNGYGNDKDFALFLFIRRSSLASQEAHRNRKRKKSQT